jgi:hypothetical protein
MVDAPVFRIAVYDKNRVFRCQIGNPVSFEATIRHNLVSTLRMTVTLDHARVPELMADGARLQVWFKGEHLISGPVTADELESDGVAGTYTVTVEDDFRILREILGWPAPGNLISTQSTAEFRKYTGNAEGIVKVAVTENGVNRLVVPGLTVAPNLARGTSIPGGLSYRFVPLADLFFPAVEDAGLGVTIKQDGTDLVLDVHEPVTFPRTLSVKGRTLRNVTVTRSRPSATRAVVGGDGDKKERYFRAVINGVREVQYGTRAETFVDAASTGSDYTDLVKDTQKAAEDLKDANKEVVEADRALDAANTAYENASQGYDTAQATGNSSVISSALTKMNNAQTKVNSRLADYNAAVADKNTKQSAYDALLASAPAALAAYQNAMDEEGAKALTENGSKNGVSLTLAGTGIFQYGPGGFHVGDRVPVDVGNGVVVTEVIRECTLKWVSPTYASVEPVAGELTNQPERITAKRIAALAKGQRNLGAR